MTAVPTSATCPACGTEASGNFCRSCGARLGSAPASARDRLTWMATGGAIVGALALVLFLVSRGGTPAPVAADTPAAPFAAGAGAGAEAESPPDISNMSPRERFDRLYNRIMKAAESGNEAEVTRFTPMALMAYQQLDTVDADARFHAALLKLHTGDVPGARALGDTVLQKNPGHLFGYIILGTVARWSKDDAELKREYAAFLKHYDAEVKSDRPEYKDHARSLADFKKAAEEAK